MRWVGNGWHVIDEIDLVAMVTDHADLARLCSELEACADCLPTRPPAEMTARLCNALDHQVRVREARLRILMERLFAGTESDPTAAVALDHIRRRCVAQVVQAQDLAAALRAEGAPLTPNTLGYMLRAFFEGCRADMAFQELAILQFAGERLTASARALLSSRFKASCAA